MHCPAVTPVDAAAAPQRSQAAQPGLSYVRGSCEVPLLEETVGQRLDRTAQVGGGARLVLP